MHEYKTYYTEDGAEVQAYKVEEPHQVATIAGPRDVAPGAYVVQRDRPELHDVFDADTFESEHSDDERSADVDADDLDDEDDEDNLDDEDSDEYDPSQHTVAEVQEYLRENPDQRDAVLARERNAGNRQSLVGN